MTRAKSAPPTPNTATYHTYVDEVVTPTLYDNFNRNMANALLALLRFLEQRRYDFSADRAFQTRPISVAAIADHFRVTTRSVQRWFANLERVGIAARVYRKNPGHKFKNLLNRIDFTGFSAWFGALAAKAKKEQRDAKSRPNKQISSRSIFNPEISEKDGCNEARETSCTPTFPKSGPIKYDKHWLAIAYENLPSRPHTPCTTATADAFRKHLNQLGIGFNHPSISKRWANFCKGRYPVR
ncbi:hypothetical protein GCM10007385_46680 [Tateyamaria omphalii]|uniref:hypothetical protein n=1 Tax=Tateyamaria omphalii TaxID=299262 RepID=UPI001675424E|nr:hypothetical protein [Tateyamaria omphalii]GGX72557.1 hypothetical protein GCM10007385_46680 [Tateyamaria omphalii]